MPGPAALRPLLLLVALGVACAGHRASRTGPTGPRHADLPLWRPGPQGERIFVFVRQDLDFSALYEDPVTEALREIRRERGLN